MTNDLLRAFLAVAESRGFSPAAALLNRTQSAVSLQIKRLEADLGVTLFARTSRSVTLTPEGRRLLPYARRLLTLADHAREEVARDRAPERIRFGLPGEQAETYLPGLLPRARAAHPGLQIEIVCDISSRLVAAFQAGDLDVILAVRHEPTRTGRPLGLKRMIWVAHPDFAPDPAAPLALALNPEGCIFRAHALAALGRAGRAWHEPYVSTSPIGLNQPVSAGLAATVKTRPSVPEGCVEAGARLGLPPLDAVQIDLHASPALVSEGFDWFVEAVAGEVRAEGAA